MDSPENGDVSVLILQTTLSSSAQAFGKTKYQHQCSGVTIWNWIPLQAQGSAAKTHLLLLEMPWCACEYHRASRNDTELLQSHMPLSGATAGGQVGPIRHIWCLCVGGEIHLGSLNS